MAKITKRDYLEASFRELDRALRQLDRLPNAKDADIRAIRQVVWFAEYQLLRYAGKVPENHALDS